MINGARAPPRPAPSLVRYSDEDDSAKGYDENPDESDSLTEKPSDISSTDSAATESEQDSTTGGSDPHSSSLVNHYANVNSTFRHSQTWKRQKKNVTNTAERGVAVPTPRPGPVRHSVSIDRGLQPSHFNSSSGSSATPQHQTTSTNPRGYSSFTDSDHDASSAVVSLNGTQIVMNNMARSRAPLPGFSSFV